MTPTVKFLAGPTFHAVLFFAWCVLAIPGLTTWRDALWWINLQSLYAILATHLSGWVSAIAAKTADEKG